MKTIDEIFDKNFYFLQAFLNYKSTPYRLPEIVKDCMREYAHQYKPKWVDVTTPNIPWPDCDVLGYNGGEYGYGSLGCYADGTVYVEEYDRKFYITHYQIPTKP